MRAPLFSWQSFGQLVRYGIVGIAQNSVGYAVYLFFTWLGFAPKLVVAVCYPCAMLVSFLGNKKFTFKFTGGWTGSGFRFVIAHMASYGINLGMLYLLTDRLGYPHQLVQAAAIFVCAGFLFAALKFFVFSHRCPDGGVAAIPCQEGLPKIFTGRIK